MIFKWIGSTHSRLQPAIRTLKPTMQCKLVKVVQQRKEKCNRKRKKHTQYLNAEYFPTTRPRHDKQAPLLILPQTTRRDSNTTMQSNNQYKAVQNITHYATLQSMHYTKLHSNTSKTIVIYLCNAIRDKQLKTPKTSTTSCSNHARQ